MRYPANASTLITVLVLLLAPEAHAECAWVLWEVSSPTASPTAAAWTYDKIAAEATHAACRQRAEIAMQRRTLQAKLAGWSVTRGEANRLEFTRQTPTSDHFVADFDCWPDTVDPREPKGGGR